MSRQPLVVREAIPEDAEELVRLWVQAGTSTEHPASLGADVPVALAQMAADPDERLIVGESDGEVVAALHMRRGPITPLHTEMVVHTSFLLVAPDHRRHGWAHALLEAAVSWAEDKGVAHVTAVAASSSRDSNRFLARLGLGTMATMRVASTQTLRKKLQPELRAAMPGSRHLGTVLAQRRSMRRRQATES